MGNEFRISSFLEEESELVDEANAIAGGNVVGYTGPMGTKGIGSDKRLEKSFWRDQSGKKVKSASPNIKMDKALAAMEEATDIVDEVIIEPKRKEPKDISQLGIKPLGGVGNILAVFNEATEEEKEYWGKWYHNAKAEVEEIAARYNLPFPVVAAITAVLSPGSRWRANLLATERLLQNVGSTEPKKIPGYPRQVANAQSILDTGNIGKVSGPKVTVFFQSLLSPESVEKNMVLDGHAINIWRGQKVSLKQIVRPNKSERAQMIADYAKASELLGVPVQAVQAVTWYIWKYTNDSPVVKPKVYDVSGLIVANNRPANDISESRYKLLESLFLEGAGFAKLIGELEEVDDDAEELLAYVDNRFPLIGSGGYRNVYDIGLSAVLKVIKWTTNKHFASHTNTENRIEIDARDCLPDEYFPKIYAFDSDNYYWLISEKVRGGKAGDDSHARKVQKAICQRATFHEYGIRLTPATETELFFDTFQDLVHGENLGPNDMKKRNVLISKNDWFRGFLGAVKKCGIAARDLHGGNWGLRLDGQPVVLDFGFDNDQELDEDKKKKRGNRATHNHLLNPLNDSAEEANEFGEGSSPKQIGDAIRAATANGGDITEFIAANNWKLIGRGTSRMVYAINSNLVLKIALKTFQNKFEISAAKCLGNEFTTKIYDWDQDYYQWIIAERVEANLQKTLDYFDDLIYAVLPLSLIRSFIVTESVAIFATLVTFKHFAAKKGIENLSPYIAQSLQLMSNKVPWFDRFADLVSKCQVNSNDFHEDNWGFRTGMKHPILLDYGFPAEEELDESKDTANVKLMNKMGYEYVGDNYRLGSDTFITKTDKNASKQRKLVSKVNANINKSHTTHGRLHDPSAMGISLPKKSKG